MTKAQKVTAIFIVSALVIILGYDIYAYVHVGDSSATISHLMIGWFHEYPVTAYLLGCLTGHLLL